jgi:hypothetical protein
MAEFITENQSSKFGTSTTIVEAAFDRFQCPIVAAGTFASVSYDVATGTRSVLDQLAFVAVHTKQNNSTLIVL